MWQQAQAITRIIQTFGGATQAANYRTDVLYRRADEFEISKSWTADTW